MLRQQPLHRNNAADASRFQANNSNSSSSSSSNNEQAARIDSASTTMATGRGEHDPVNNNGIVVPHIPDENNNSNNKIVVATTEKNPAKPIETIFDADFTIYARDALHYGDDIQFDKTYSKIPTRCFGQLTWRVQCTRTWSKQNGIYLSLTLEDQLPTTACPKIVAPLKINVRIELEQIVPDYCYNERLKLTYLFTPGKCMTLGPLKLVSESEIEALQNADFSRFRSPQSWECPKCQQWQESINCSDCFAENVYYCFFCREGRVFVLAPTSPQVFSQTHNNNTVSTTTSSVSGEEESSDISSVDNDDILPRREKPYIKRINALRFGSNSGRRRLGIGNSPELNCCQNSEEQQAAEEEGQAAHRCPECNAFCINSLRFTFLNPHGNLRCWIKVDGEKQQLIEPNIVPQTAEPVIADVQAWAARDTDVMKRLADCVVEAEGKQISAHSAILASRSRYFQALIKMHQKSTRCRASARSSAKPLTTPLLTWCMPCSFTVAEMILFHLYTNQAPQIPSITLAYELLRMTDLYHLTRLKTQCEAMLYNEINKTNACHMTLVADECNALQLRDYAVNYCQWNLKAVIQSPEWEQMCYPEHSHLVSMITTGQRPRSASPQPPTLAEPSSSSSSSKQTLSRRRMERN